MPPKDFPIFGALTLFGVVVWTLLPDSHSLAVLWPYSLLWQVTLFLPIGWLLGQLWHKPLAQFQWGGGFDWIALGWILVLGISTLASAFPHQSLGYSLGALAMMAGVYALKGVLTSPQRWEKLWTFQGILGILLSLESLVLWWVQVYQPEQARLDRLNHDYGVQLSFNLQNLDLQNGFPFGHQNYVAGYIALTLPIVLGLWMVHGGWKRWLWFIGLGIQILDLYTTSSRGGWIAVILGFLVFFFPLVWFYRSRLRIPVILGMLGILGLLIFSIVKNDRLRPFFMALGTGDLENSQLTYRIITNTIGWNMGLSRPWTGLGLGNVPIVYQAFHPIWAGGEAELHYQLHSTPAQLWAELGIGGIIMTLALIFAVMWGTYRWFKSLAISLNLSPQLLNNSSPFTLEKSWIIPLSLMAALVSYGFMTLTDYQADNLGMMASLALIFVTLWQYLYPAAIPPDLESLEPLPPVSKLSSHLPWHQRLTLAGIGFCCALEIALLPMQRSWAIAHRGFNALADHHTADFVTLLTRAHNLSPWEPYYPLQLAWNLGEQSRETPGNSPQNAKEITQEIIQQREQAIQWFQTAINITPYQEFSHSNQGWLWLQQGQPKQAQIAFQNALNLLPAKEGIWFGLGLSYLVNRQNELALNSFSQELLRHPDQIISLIWQTPPLNTWIIPLYDHLDQRCSQWLNKTDLHPQLVTYFHHIRGLIRWWRGDFEGAKTDWQNVVNPNINSSFLSLLDISNHTNSPLRDDLPPTPGIDFLRFWQTQDPQWLDRAMQTLIQTTVPSLDLASLRDSVQRATAQHQSLLEWLKNPQQYRVYRPERLGFGVLNRHIGGAIPQDYNPRFQHLFLTHFFPELLPQRPFFPVLDEFLAQERQKQVY